MNTQTTLVGIGTLVLLGLGGWFLISNQSAPAPTQNSQQVVSEPNTTTHSLSLVARKLTPDTVTVTQGEQVTITVTSDEAGEFHISGYEIENDMEKGKELTFSFMADKAGRYNFELHPAAEAPSAFRFIPVAEASENEGGAEGEAEEDIVIGAFVVNPR